MTTTIYTPDQYLRLLKRRQAEYARQHRIKGFFLRWPEWFIRKGDHVAGITE
jgi:hypothetical protein